MDHMNRKETEFAHVVDSDVVDCEVIEILYPVEKKDSPETIATPVNSSKRKAEFESASTKKLKHPAVSTNSDPLLERTSWGECCKRGAEGEREDNCQQFVPLQQQPSICATCTHKKGFHKKLVIVDAPPKVESQSIQSQGI